MNMHFDDIDMASRDILSRYRVGVWTIEIEEGCEPRMYVDGTMASLMGITGKILTPEETYRAWYDRVDPQHYDAVADGVDRMVNGLIAEIQYPWIHPTNGVMYVRCGAKRDMSCREFIRLEGTHQDVTELNHVQKESREDVIVREKLNMERRRYMMMCNLIKSAQWSFTYDANARMTSVLWSDEFRHLLGYDNGDDFPNELESWHRLIHPDDLAKVEHDIEAVVNDRTGKEVYDVIYRLQTRDRGWRWVRARGEVSRVADGKPMEFAGVLTDVDAEQRNAKLQEERLAALEAVKRTSDQLAKALVEAKRAEQRESTFLATMSHEIRTPLNAIIGFAEFLRDAGCTMADRESYVLGILNSSNALLALINDILDLSKIQAGMMPFRGGSCDLAQLFDEMDTIFRFNADKKNIKLVKTLPPDLPTVALREERIRQILINLIGNAVKFTLVGEVEYAADVKRHSDGKCSVEIIVRDTGVGIPSDKYETIFDPFAQDGSVRGGRVYQGTGLGLSICRRLLEAVGGTISVASTIGKGSVFTVHIPNVDIAMPAGDAEAGDAPDCKLPPGFSVMVVDDVEMNLRIVSKHLELIGVSKDGIRCFTSAREALQSIAAEGLPSVVFTDVWMPDMNGEAFARALRDDPRTAGIPVVAQTADADTVADPANSPFVAVLTKPLTGEKIRRLLATLRI